MEPLDRTTYLQWLGDPLWNETILPTAQRLAAYYLECAAQTPESPYLTAQAIGANKALRELMAYPEIQLKALEMQEAHAKEAQDAGRPGPFSRTWIRRHRP